MQQKVQDPMMGATEPSLFHSAGKTKNPRLGFGAAGHAGESFATLPTLRYRTVRHQTHPLGKQAHSPTSDPTNASNLPSRPEPPPRGGRSVSGGGRKAGDSG